MVITIVSFRAYDRDCKEAFTDKSFEQIHQALTDKCNTYVPSSILHGTMNAEFLPLQTLTQFKNEDTNATADNKSA